MKRKPPPDLEFRAPECPTCGTETCADPDAFYCEECGATWDRDGRGGEWDEPDAEACPSTIQPYRDDPKYPILRPLIFHCVWAEGHDGKHFNPDGYRRWTDADAKGLTA